MKLRLRLPSRQRESTAHPPGARRWRVRAWVIAPGDFPSRDLKAVEVNADRIETAIAKAERSLAFQSDATVVSAERINPPAGKER